MGDESQIDKVLMVVAEQCIDKASSVLSKTVRSGAKIELKNVTLSDITDVTAVVNETNHEVAVAYIDLMGDTPFKFLFFVSIRSACTLTDLFVELDPGTTTEYNELVESTVQEIGNILASAITNVFTKNFDIAMQPSPPQVTCDFSGSLFEQFVMSAAMSTDQILLIESEFILVKHHLECFMYMLPMEGSEALLGLSSGGF
jgi:chemotaxis protein CheC